MTSKHNNRFDHSTVNCLFCSFQNHIKMTQYYRILQPTLMYKNNNKKKKTILYHILQVVKFSSCCICDLCIIYIPKYFISKN